MELKLTAKGQKHSDFIDCLNHLREAERLCLGWHDKLHILNAIEWHLARTRKHVKELFDIPPPAVRLVKEPKK